MLDTNNFDYETTTLYDALKAYTNRNEKQNDNVTNSTNTTWPGYDVCDPSSYPEDFLTSSLFQGCIYLMYSIVFLVALIGNGLVCFVVQTSPRMKTVTNYFIVNLAVGDILMTLFCVPFSFVPMLILRYWPFGFVMCKVVNYTQAVSVLVSAYTLLAISIDRYMAIMRPLRPRLGKAAAKMVVAVVWLGAFTTAAPIVVVSKLQRPTPWHQMCKADICLEEWEHVGQSGQYTCALLILQFALPLGALVCTYARIAHAVWGGRPPGEAQDARDSRLQHSKRKMIKMMVIVVTVFTMCWLPLNMFIVLWTIHEEDERWATWPGMPFMWFACHWLAMSHSCYNPIIYCYMNNRYRRGFKQAFGCIFRIRLDTSSRNRTSMCEGVQMSDETTHQNRLYPHHTLEHHMLELKNHSTEIKTIHSELEKSMSSISDQMLSLEKTITSLEKERSSLVAKVMSLEEKLEFLDRNQIKTSIEIRNVPKRANETKNMLYDMISNLSKQLEIVTESSNIRDVARQPSKKETLSSNITVEFANTLIKTNFLNAVKDYNKKHSTDKVNSLHLGIKSTTGNPIYIAELLTPYTKRLFYATRTYAKLNKYSYCWTSNGRVMLKKDSDSQSIVVKSELQLQQLSTNKQT